MESAQESSHKDLCAQGAGAHTSTPEFILMVSFFTALLWLVHPVQVQSVTYIVQRMNSMAAMFYILSMLFYVHGRRRQRERPAEKAWQAGHAWPWLAGSAAAGLMALGSKEISLTLPFFIFLYEWYFFQDLNTAWLKKVIIPLLPILLLIAVIAFFYLGKDPLGVIIGGYQLRDFTMLQRLLTESRVVLFYISLLILPHPSRLNLEHDVLVSTSILTPASTLLSILVIAAITGTALITAKKYRLLSFSLFWYLGNLAIESTILNLEIIFEHRVYLPGMFLIFLAILTLFRKLPVNYALVLLCAIALLFSNWTWQRNSTWQDPFTLVTDCAYKSPNKARVRYNLAGIYKEKGNIDEAIHQYFLAIKLKPDYARAYINLANIMMTRNQYEPAMKLYLKALELKPDSAMAHYNLGVALVSRARPEEAVHHFLKVLEAKPDSLSTLNNLGIVFMNLNRLDESVRYFEKALAIRPDSPDIEKNLSVAKQKRDLSGRAASSE